MYEPELGFLQSFDSVLIPTEDGFAVGRFRGGHRPESESYKIHVIDPLTDEEKPPAWYHKEDLYKNTKENAEMLKA